jgi:hypothetical protein
VQLNARNEPAASRRGQTPLGPLLLPRENGVMLMASTDEWELNEALVCQPFKYLLLSLGVSAGHVVEGPAGDA